MYNLYECMFLLDGIFYRKKKKDKERDAKKVFEQISSHSKNTDDGEKPQKEVRDIRTKAEIAVDKAREKRVGLMLRSYLMYAT